ncbi:mfs general substrate transporter, partial [Apiospora phragmitis]
GLSVSALFFPLLRSTLVLNQYGKAIIIVVVVVVVRGTGRHCCCPEWTPGRQEWCCMISIAIVSVMVALDATVLVPVLPSLALELDGSTIDAFWAGTSYLLACAVSQPFIAALSDIFGRKEMLFSSVVFFTAGTALCAPIAKNFTVFFAGRTLQGIGGGGIITMGQVIYADIVPLRQRPKYFSIVLAAWAIGSVIGPLIGGVFVDKLNWKWCFYINFPFCLIGLVTVPIFVKLSGEKSSFASKMKRVDWVGGFLFIGGMTSFLVGLSWAGIEYGWSSIQVIVPMVAGTVAVFFTIMWEVHCAREPFLRPSIFSSRSAVAAYTCAFAQGFLLFCALYYVPFYFMAVRSTTPTQSGVNLLPVSCCLVPGSIVVSILASRLGRFRWAVWAGLVLTAVGCGLLQDLDEDTGTALWAAVFAVFGIGNGMMLTSVNVAIQAISRTEDCGRAAAMYAFMRTLGMSIGVAVGGTVFQNFMSAKLDELGLPERIAHEAEAFVAELDRMPPLNPTRVGAVQAYIHGFRGVFWIMTAMACVGFLASLFIQHHSMDRILESRFVLDGGDGAEMRENLDVLEKRLARMSKRASHHLMSMVTAPTDRYSRRNRSTVALSQLYGGGMGLGGGDDDTPLPGDYGPATPGPHSTRRRSTARWCRWSRCTGRASTTAPGWTRGCPTGAAAKSSLSCATSSRRPPCRTTSPPAAGGCLCASRRTTLATATS